MPLFSTSFRVLLGQLEGSVRFALGFLPGALYSRFFCLFLRENAYIHRNPGSEKHISSARRSSGCSITIITQTDSSSCRRITGVASTWLVVIPPTSSAFVTPAVSSRLERVLSDNMVSFKQEHSAGKLLSLVDASFFERELFRNEKKMLLSSSSSLLLYCPLPLTCPYLERFSLVWRRPPASR